MTVRELIEELEKIDNKELVVIDNDYRDIFEFQIDKIGDNYYCILL